MLARSRALGRTWSGRGAGLADQILSGLSNVLAVVLVARALSAADFGRFALAYATLTVTLTLSRSFLATRISLAPTSELARTRTEQLMTAVLVLAPLITLVVFGLAAAVTGGRSLGILLLVAIATPIVCAQDLIRFGVVASGRPAHAVVSDGCWLLVVAVPIALPVQLSPGAALGLWLAGAVAALLVAMAVSGLRPRRTGGLAQLRTRDRVGESVTLGTILTAVASLTVLFVVARVIGSAPAGALRGAATAMAPINVLLAFVSLGLAPALVRRSRRSDLRFCLAVGGTLGVLTVLWAGALLMIPAEWGAAAFGRSWPGIRHVLSWTLVEYVGLSVAAAAALGLKVRGRAREMVVQRVLASVVALVGGTAWAVTVEEVRGVAAMLALSAFVLAVCAWLQLVRAVSRAPDGQAG